MKSTTEVQASRGGGLRQQPLGDFRGVGDGRLKEVVGGIRLGVVVGRREHYGKTKRYGKTRPLGELKSWFWNQTTA